MLKLIRTVQNILHDRRQSYCIRAILGIAFFTPGYLGEGHAQKAAEREKVVQILFTTDIHGQLTQSASEQEDRIGSAVKLARRIRQRRRSFGPERTLLLDCGDTCQGSLSTALSRGAAGIAFLRAMNYDIWIPGNHDFAFGLRRFRKLCQEFSGHTLSGNVRYRIGQEWKRPKAWLIVERNGIRIGVIGATRHGLEQSLWGDHVTPLETTALLPYIQKILPEVLHETPDVIVLALHDGWSYPSYGNTKRLRQVAQQFPAIDLIVGGHTHRTIPGRKLGHSTWYVQAGAHAEALGVVVLTVEPATGRIRRIKSRLLPVQTSTEPDRKAEIALQKYIDRAQNAHVRPIGRLASSLESKGKPGRNCGTSELISQAVYQAVNADAAVYGRPTAKTLSQGDVTQSDIYELLPYGNHIATATLTGEQLRAILREQQSHHTSHAYCGLYGLHAHITENSNITRLTWPDGSPVGRDERLKVAFSSYTVAGAGGRFAKLQRIVRRPEAHLKDTGQSTRQVVTRFVKRNSPLHLPVKQWLRQAD